MFAINRRSKFSCIPNVCHTHKIYFFHYEYLIPIIYLVPKYDCNPDYVNWTGSQGMTCQMYLDSNWCTPDGQLGDFGKHQKIRMAEMAKNGYQGANCPQCGCGEQISKFK